MNKNKLIVLGLLFSLAMNLLFIGGIAYRSSNYQTEYSGRPLPPNVGWLARDLEEDRRSELQPLLQQSFEEIGPLRRDMITAQRRVNELISAQPFDSNALNQAFTELRTINLRYQELSHQQTSKILTELTEQERQTALEFIQRRGPRDGRDWFRGREGGSGFRRSDNPDGQRRLPPFPPQDPVQ